MLVRSILFASLIFLSLKGFSQAYKWVDEDGAVHFGDEVPAEYEGHVEEVDTEIKNIVKMPAPEEKPLFYMPPKKNLTDLSSRPSWPTIQQRNYSTADNSCEAQWQAYRAAESCFGRCSSPIPGGGRNIAGCSCTDLKRPRCNE